MLNNVKRFKLMHAAEGDGTFRLTPAPLFYGTTVTFDIVSQNS